MLFQPVSLRINHGSTKSAVCSSPPHFSWAAENTKQGSRQSAYSICVKCGDDLLWESGWVESEKCEALYCGTALPEGRKIDFSVKLRDNYGNESKSAQASFMTVKSSEWKAQWITKASTEKEDVTYFCKNFNVEKKISAATLFVCGIGLCEAYINGKRTDDYMLSPALTSYEKHCSYITLDVTDKIETGINIISAAVGGGWRTNIGDYLKIVTYEPTFFGQPQLICELMLVYEDGSKETVVSDESWHAFDGAVTYANIFQGEVYDATKAAENWNKKEIDIEKYPYAVKAKQHTMKLIAQNTEPVRIIKRKQPKVVFRSENRLLIDFGVNLAGVVEIKIPEGLNSGDKITIRHAEVLSNDGELFTDTLRTAAATDVYISNGKDAGNIYRPYFTYHGFRYAELTGAVDLMDDSDICALVFYNDMDNESFFNCGSPVVNAIQNAIVQTERCNLHYIATDCPQRDERMAWMNDATVRFEEMPYNFDADRLLGKIISDITADQDLEGAISSVTPRVYGSHPADPVCSSYLVAALQMYLHYNDVDIIKKYYSNFAAWNEYLKKISKEGIVEYGVYGDWAAPADYCKAPEDPHSSVTPESLMSTGYHYYNYILLEKMAKLTENESNAVYFADEAEKVRRAFLEKWYDEKTGSVATGSQGCLTFALWLDILPEEGRNKTAALLYKKIEEDGNRLTTGNLTSRYIFDVLSRFGYVDKAWELMERTEYPSLGFMIKNGATTIWERFELKQNKSMNSHNHPMYGAIGYWFYAYLVGLIPKEGGWRSFSLKPHIPQNLNFAEAQLDTPAGKIYAKWMKQYGETVLTVKVPFGAECTVELDGKSELLMSGVHTLKF